MNEKTRLFRVIEGKEVDRPPVICPGGMMNAAVTEVVKELGSNHNVEVDEMVEAAKRVRELAGFENFGVPFCMTCEPEPFGVELSFGDKNNEPRVSKYNHDNVYDIMKKYDNKHIETQRGKNVLKAIEKLKNSEVPVVGNITGPISTASSVIDPLEYFKMLRKAPEAAYDFTEYINDYLIEYAIAMYEAGADVLAVSDPTATGEILGQKNFDKFAMPMYRKFLKFMKKNQIPVILHICGNARNIIPSLNTLDVEVLSFDSIINMRYAKKHIDTRLMGNVNTLLLQQGEGEKIVSITKNAIDSGVDIVSPACGLGMSTPLKNLRAMTNCVKE